MSVVQESRFKVTQFRVVGMGWFTFWVNVRFQILV